jgi:hypothetical protein
MSMYMHFFLYQQVIQTVAQVASLRSQAQKQTMHAWPMHLRVLEDGRKVDTLPSDLETSICHNNFSD